MAAAPIHDKREREQIGYGTTKIGYGTTPIGCMGGTRRYVKGDSKIGPTKTKMTKNLRQGFLYSNPERVSSKIYEIIQKESSMITYIPFWWKYIMIVIKIIPNIIYHKIKL